MSAVLIAIALSSSAAYKPTPLDLQQEDENNAVRVIIRWNTQVTPSAAI
jgi:hypothetical protein